MNCKRLITLPLALAYALTFALANPAISQASSASDNVVVSQQVYATSTPPVEEETEEGTTGETEGPLRFEYLILTPSTNSIRLEWKTNHPTLAEVSWGVTQDYRDGVLSETTYEREHVLTLTDLKKDTEYFVRILVRTERGTSLSVSRSVTTLPAEDITAPSNVTKLRAVPDHATGDITLTWNNPKDPDFSYVRIVRSETFFPLSPDEGRVVYEGDAERFVDSVGTWGIPLYYSVYSRDVSGNYSSGVSVVTVLIRFPAQDLDDPEVVIPEVPTPTDPFEDVPVSDIESPEVEALKVTDFTFAQNGKSLRIWADSVEVDTVRDTDVSLGYEKVPEVLKTIALSVRSPHTGEYVVYILRVNSEKTSYDTVMSALIDEGLYPSSITMLDYQNRKLTTLPLTFDAYSSGDTKTFIIGMLNARNLIKLITLILLMAAILLVWRKEEKNDYAKA